MRSLSQNNFKGQSAVEFFILVGAVFFFFITFAFIIQINNADKIGETRNTVAREIAFTIQDEINLASLSGEGYSRSFTLPSSLAGLDYNASIVGESVFVRTDNGRHALSLPVPLIVGDLNIGENQIKSFGGNICLNVEDSECSNSSIMCGNDMIEGGEECDGSDLGGETCISQGFSGGTLGCDSGCGFDTSQCTSGVSNDLRVFVTSTTHQGNFGVLEAADTICQGLADAVPALQGETWKAWISNTTESAADRLTQTTGDYKLVDDSVIANGWGDLTDGSIDTQILLDESGSAVSDFIWTATTIDGSSDSLNCQEWTTIAGGQSGGKGSTDQADNFWTDWFNGGCNQFERFYCFEQ